MELKKDWEKKKLGEVSTVTSSKRIFKDEYVPEGIPFYRTKEIKELSHNEPISLELFISKEKYEEIKKNFGVPQIGDVLISAVGTIGEILVIENDDPFYFKDGNIIWLKNLTSFNSDYLKYQLQSFVDELKNMTRGAAYNALTIEKLKEFELPVPPLEEQKRIVKILDEKFAQLETIKTNAQTNLQNAKDLFQSQLTKAFSNTTWEKKRLGDSSELITKGSSPKWQGINYVTDDGILFVTSENVRENYIDLEKSKYLEKKFNDKQKRSILKKNDVLVNIVGASIGRAAIFDFDIVDANINQAVALIRSKNEIDVHFLSYFLNSDNAMNQYNNAKKDTARANLSLEDINNLRIPLPPLPEQKRIVEELDTLSEKVRQLQEIYTKQIANCDELKQSLLQKAFEASL